MFGIDDVLIGSAITAGFNYLTAEDTNDQNAHIAENNSAFNADQARITREFNASQGELTRNYNSAEATKQREWEEMMSNTSWQRGTRDMQAAGINPMLAFMKGGASTPSGATASSAPVSAGGTAQAVNYVRQNPALAATMAGQAFMSNANTAADIKLKESQADKNYAEASNTRQETYIRSYTASMAAEFTRQDLAIKRETEQQIIAQTGATATQAALYATATAKAAAETDLTKEETELVKKQVINAVKTARQIDANTENTKANTALTKIQKILADLDIPGAQNRAGYNETPIGTAMPGIRDAFSLINSGADAYNAFKRVAPYRRTTIDSGSGVRTEYGRHE